MPFRVDLNADGCPRFSSQVELAVYFCCLEALQNVAKHCGPAARASVFLKHNGNGVLQFEVTDDGPGFNARPAYEMNGITSMRDRTLRSAASSRSSRRPAQARR
jgi:signal transduction histidine kinase